MAEKIAFWSATVIFGGGTLIGILSLLGWVGWQAVKWGISG